MASTTPMLTITDEKGNTYTMAETYTELMKAYNFYHKEKERQREKARRAYVPHPRVVKQPAQVVQVVAVEQKIPEPVAPVTPKPTRKRVSKVEATPLEEKVKDMDI